MPSMSQPRQTFHSNPQDPYGHLDQIRGASFSHTLPAENVAYSQAHSLPLSPRGTFPPALTSARFAFDNSAIPQLSGFTDFARSQPPSGGDVLGHSTLQSLNDTAEVKYHSAHNAMQPRQATAVTTQAQPTTQHSSDMHYTSPVNGAMGGDGYHGAYQFQAPGSWPAGKDANYPANDVLPKGARKGKRKSVIAEHEEPQDDDKKRTRGRPRLDTKDQTPEERRRTQIRLAQRAYRSRKESAITELESKLQAQKEMNEEMKEAYQSIFEHATRHGILHRDPQFSHQMQKLQSSWKRLHDDEPKTDSTGSPDGSSKESPHEPASAIERTLPERKMPVAVDPASSTQTQQMYNGLVLPPASEQGTRTHPVPHAQGYNTSMAEPGRVEYQIITSPTADNASFAGLFHPPSIAWAHSPWEALPAPSTFSHQESNLSRRLHRFTCEKAARLITLPNPPCDKMLRVFGFARLFETTDQIRERTLSTIRKMAHESLDNWTYPFHHLGGAGTHMPGRRSGSESSGQSGLSAMETGGFRMGPMDVSTSHIRSSMLTITQGMRVPGLQGVFWDCEEVEFYMRQNGVPLPDLASADFLSAELSPSSFNYRDPNGDGQPGTGSEARPEEMVQVTGAPNPSNPVISMPTSDVQNPLASVTMAPPVTGHPDAMRAPTAEPVTAWPVPPVTSAAGLSTAGFYATVGVEHNGYAQRSPLSQFPPMSGRRMVRIDVARFLEGLTARTVCLGRTPGFRPNDVDEAFWAAIVSESDM